MDLTETMKGLVKNMQQQEASNQQQQQQQQASQQFSGIGYISEKLYLLLQLYLQNKSWNPSVELLQCFTELKDASMLPSAAYLQMVANRVTLDNQARLVLRDNGKIILPFEHFANAVMLKHMNGPHGLHLGLEATIRAVMESYTVGRDNFGMEKDFVIEVVQNCPNPTCRFYKSQMDQLTQKSLQHLSSQAAAAAAFHAAETNAHQQQQQQQQHQHSGSSSSSSFSPAEISNASFPSSVGSAVDLTERVAAAVSGRGHLAPPSAPQAATPEADQADRLAEFLRANFDSLDGLPGAKDFLALQNGVWPMFETDKRATAIEGNNNNRYVPRSISYIVFTGQEKIVRTFSEIMKNMARMKTCVRPSMCKPYGKQSEALQKTLVDTIQLVQSLRSFLPPPHITVTSWKEEEHKHRPGSKSSLRTLGKPPGAEPGSIQSAAAAALLADNLQHLVRPPKKYE